MSRPKKHRRIDQVPSIKGMKPFIGGKIKSENTVNINFEEYEAIRLADHLGLNHIDSALKMNISRPTFTRILNGARKKIADAIILSKVFIIEGGNVYTDSEIWRCDNCLIVFREKLDFCNQCSSENITRVPDSNELLMEEKMLTDQRMGNVGNCICTKCEFSMPHRKGVPCKDQRCPKCGSKMLREGSYHHDLLKQKRGEK